MANNGLIKLFIYFLVDGDLINFMCETGLLSSMMNHILSPVDVLKEVTNDKLH